MATVQLAKIEREKRPEPFTVELTDGSEVTFADPKRLHFTVVMALDDLPPQEQVKALTGDGWEAMKTDAAMDAEALEFVMSAWREHYKLNEDGSSAKL